MNLITNLAAVYSANSNILGVVLLNERVFAEADYRVNAELRMNLANWGEVNDIDSIMVLSGISGLYDIQKRIFTMYVFEPKGIDDTEMPGSWSSMCGNGLMAASLFFEDHFRRLYHGEQIYFRTNSGLRIVSKVGNGEYSACMGEFIFGANDLERYVRLDQPKAKTEWFQVTTPRHISLNFCNTWSIGFSGDRGVAANGEPHVVLFGHSGQLVSMSRLISMANQDGPLVTKNTAIFPNEINVNFAIVQKIDHITKQIYILGCTHERGLGNERSSVTGACGTGATAMAATLFRVHSLDDSYVIHVRMPGGTLRVYRELGKFYLIGKAKKIKSKITT